MKNKLENLGLSSMKVLTRKLLSVTWLLSFLFFFASFFISPVTIYATPAGFPQQTKKITGTITDQKGTTLPGVSVTVKGTSIGTSAGADGKFSLDVPANAETLVFSFIGMTIQEVAIGGKTQIDVTMAEETKALDEVVVVGYGVQKKVNLTGSITSIKTEGLTTIATQSLPQAIMGKSPGLFIKNVSGQPGRTNNVSYFSLAYN